LFAEILSSGFIELGERLLASGCVFERSEKCEKSTMAVLTPKLNKS
jgi:hypothetical protein